MSRKGGFIRMRHGGTFWPTDPRPEDVNIKDIAWALSMTCRFNGHVLEFYSVAEHSVRVCRLVESKWPQLALQALLHDAQESLGINDLPSPTKRSPELAGYRAVEERIRLAIAKRFGLPEKESPEIKWADLCLLATEGRDLLITADGMTPGPEPLKAKIRPWSPERARREFMREFKRLYVEPAKTETVRNIASAR